MDKAKASTKKFATERFPDTIGKHVRAGLPPKVVYAINQILGNYVFIEVLYRWAGVAVFSVIVG